jgi:hypothetical protein
VVTVSLLLLNVLLMTVGPFLVVAPLALAARLSCPSGHRVRRPLFRTPAFRFPSIRLEVSW